MLYLENMRAVSDGHGGKFHQDFYQTEKLQGKIQSKYFSWLLAENYKKPNSESKFKRE